MNSDAAQNKFDRCEKEECNCCPCKHNKNNNPCIRGCKFVHKNETGLFICKHHCDVTNRPCDPQRELKKQFLFVSREFQLLQQRYGQLFEEYHSLRRVQADSNHEQALLVTQLKQENDCLRQQLEQKSRQTRSFVAAFIEPPRLQPAKMTRGGYCGGREN